MEISIFEMIFIILLGQFIITLISLIIKCQTCNREKKLPLIENLLTQHKNEAFV